MKKTATKTEVETPEITIDGLLESARQGEENGKAILYKELGVKEFLTSLKNEGYEIVKKDA